MNLKTRIRTVIVLFLALGISAAAELAAQGRQAMPPEYKELVAAYELKDPALRIKEFERIRAAYPNTPFKDAIEAGVLQARVELAENLEAVLALQNDYVAKGKGPARLQSPLVMAIQLFRHPRIGSFDAPKVLQAVLRYRDISVKAGEDASSYEGIPQNQREFFKSQVLNAFELIASKAYLNAGDTAKAMAALDGYRASSGSVGANYLYSLAAVKEKMGRLDEAYEAYLAAAVEDFEDAAERAKALHVRIHGTPDTFAAALEAKARALPFHPEPFKAPVDWRGKAVLAELFTGSECPPCVGADIAFDGLIETIPVKYLAVLVYHLPIPRPDPMMNPASEARESYYGVNSTPTIVIDGTDKSTGGGGRGAAEGKFAQLRAAIVPLLSGAPPVAPKVLASLAGDTVKVAYDFDKILPSADYNLVLVQDEQEHKGGNGVVYHRMVVRDILKIDPASPRTAAFDLVTSEKAADAYLTAFERSYSRTPNFKWDVRRHVLPRKGLKIVFFIQEKETKKVLNAVVADVM